MVGKHYSQLECELIRELARQGLGATAIAKKLANRTPGGVQGQLVKMGFVSPQRSQAAKAYRRRSVNVEQHKRFCDYLRDNIDQAPPIELMRCWNEQAPRRGLFTVSVDMVDYWIDKMKIRLSPAEARANPAYQVVYQRRYARRRETARATFERRAEIRREELKAERQKLVDSDREVPKHACSECGESWPVTKDFFRAKRDRKGNRTYFETTACILCANKNRRRITRLRTAGKSREEIRRLLKAEERRRRNAKSEALVKQARLRRKKLIESNKRTPLRGCIDCGETWPLHDEFWKQGTNSIWPRFCRFCDNKYRRDRMRSRADGRPLAAVRAERRSLLQRSMNEKRDQNRANLQAEAKKIKLRTKSLASRTCTICHYDWPLREEFWLFEPKDGPRAGKLARRYCRCCSHDKDAERNRYRKRARQSRPEG